MKLKTLLLTTFVATAAVAAGSANAALDSTLVTALQTEILGDVGTAVSAGFAIMTVVLGSSVGMSLLGRFASKGANGG